MTICLSTQQNIKSYMLLGIYASNHRGFMVRQNLKQRAGQIFDHQTAGETHIHTFSDICSYVDVYTFSDTSTILQSRTFQVEESLS